MGKIKELIAEIDALKKKLEIANNRIKKEKYGITWLDVPEGFEKETENQLPILTEVKEKAIKNEDGKPTHILIEGDNYHSLTCLNYTHKGKIDLIYIDPPYNTGSDGFTYKDKRVLKKYPDGTIVKKENPLRHSIWLSFMHKRLDLAKELLSDDGVIFISIDDNEVANLKLLMNQIFGIDNFVAQFIRKNKAGSGHDSSQIAIEFDYMLCFSKNKSKVKFQKEVLDVENDKKYRFEDQYIKYRGKHYLRDLDYKGTYSESGDYSLKMPNETEVFPGGKFGKPNTWRWSKEKVEWGIKNNYIVFKKVKDSWKIYIKQYQFVDNKNNLRERQLPYRALIQFLNSEGSQELNNIIQQNIFKFPKSTALIEFCIKLLYKKNITVLDFFAGSGTTGHSVLNANCNDNGKRQFILCTNNEGSICEKVTYPRIKNIIKGYSDLKKNKVKGLGNSLKYYKTDFVGANNILYATDKDKSSLAHKAGYLLSIAENTLEEIELSSCYQLFENDKKVTAIYFKEDTIEMNIFLGKVENIKKPITLYLFSWEKEKSEFEALFAHLDNVKIKTIPEPILDIYKKIYNIITI